jgi:hypothetical protein
LSSNRYIFTFLIFEATKYICLAISIFLILRTCSKNLLKISTFNQLVLRINMIQILSSYALIDVYTYQLFDGILKKIVQIFKDNSVFHTKIFRFIFDLQTIDRTEIWSKIMYFDHYYGKGSEIESSPAGLDLFDTLDYTSFYFLIILINAVLLCTRYGKRVSCLRILIANLYFPKLIGLFYSHTWLYGKSLILNSSDENSILSIQIDLIRWNM